ncbi:MAG: hypothetical protein JWR67_3332 [Mucilaginibacter sp.]|nr:hypothetical protein [Mucilaginibacter sp.]
MIKNTDDLETPVIKINGISYIVNLNEIKDFIAQCKPFMDVNGNEFEIMTQTIADALIDSINPELPIKQLKSQLKFLREVGFLLKNLIAVNE